MSRFAITTGWKPWKPNRKAVAGLLGHSSAWSAHTCGDGMRSRTATTSRSTTAPGMRARPSKRRCRKPSRARVAGRCPWQPLSGNPIYQCYIGEWRGVHRAHLAGTGQWCFGPPVRRRVLCDVAGDHPGRHADGVPRAPRLCGRNAYRSGVSVCPLLSDPGRGQLWVG